MALKNVREDKKVSKFGCWLFIQYKYMYVCVQKAIAAN